MSLDAQGVHRLLEAIHFAADQHRAQHRKGPAAIPYINHPIVVVEQLAAHGFGGDLDLLMAAVLHDVIEDTDATFEEVSRRFGPRVAAIVQEVSDDKSLEKEVRKRLVVETARHKSREARLIKLSDLAANVHDIVHHPPPWSLERKLNYLLWAEQVAASVAGTHAGLEAALDEKIAATRRLLGPPAA
jgi:guanosine-3',5'-bis(diphosphate) 3'-pyrophosphohydrolase